jgi:hypothetical protein
MMEKIRGKEMVKRNKIYLKKEGIKQGIGKAFIVVWCFPGNIKN